MEYQETLDVLNNVLVFIPEDIVEFIIFEYVVNSNKYIYKYTVSHGTLHNAHFNKQLGIICCKSDVDYKFIDYKTGYDHDGSLINVKQFNDEHASSEIIYFNNKMIIHQNQCLSNCILQDQTYVSNQSEWDFLYCNSLFCIQDKHIFVIEINSNEYNIHKLDFNFDTINKSLRHLWDKHELYVSAHDDILYIWQIDRDGTNISVHTHDVNTLKLLNVNDYKREYETYFLDRKVYQNKLYEYVHHHHDKNEIKIYDLMTMEQIHSFDIDDRYLSSNTKLSIDDDILIISDTKRTLFYDIK